MAMAATKVKAHGFGIIEGVFSLVASGSYSTGGDSLDFAPVMGYTNKQPTWVHIEGIAGYIYEYDYTNKKVLVRQSGSAANAGTVAITGTSTKPTFTVNAGTLSSTLTVGLDADSAAANFIGSTGVTTNRTLTTTSPVGTPTLTLTGTFSGTASTAAALAEIPASSYPAGVTGDTITARVAWFM